MDIPVAADVECRDGRVGTSTCVIIDPTRQAVTHVVVREHRFPRREWLVPVDSVGHADARTIRLDCDRQDLEALESFTRTEFVDAAEMPYPRLGNEMDPFGDEGDIDALWWPYVTSSGRPSDTIPIERERVPKGELAIRRGAQVEATDGVVGRVDQFVVDPSDDHITHLLVRTGHLWAAREVAVPLAAIASLGESTVRLALSRDGVEALPAVAVHRHVARSRQEVGAAGAAAAGLEPEAPDDAGVAASEPDTGHIEAARVLANEAEEILVNRGFTDDEVRAWAEAYVAEEGSGDVKGLLSWIRNRERH